MITRKKGSIEILFQFSEYEYSHIKGKRAYLNGMVWFMQNIDIIGFMPTYMQFVKIPINNFNIELKAGFKAIYTAKENDNFETYVDALELKYLPKDVTTFDNYKEWLISEAANDNSIQKHIKDVVCNSFSLVDGVLIRVNTLVPYVPNEVVSRNILLGRCLSITQQIAINKA